MAKNPFVNFKFGEKSTYFLLIFCFAVIASAFCFPLISAYVGSLGHDSHWYIKLSEGRISEVLKPFSGRILEPFIAGWLQRTISLDTAQSFFLIGAISFFLFFVFNSIVLKKTIKAPPFLIVPILFLPYFIETFREFFLPDIFYICLTALFFFFLFRGLEGFSLITLFLLFLTRESTILLGIVILFFSLLRSKKMLFWGTLAVIILSVFVTNQISSFGLPNPHNVSGFFYLALKFTYNFFNNFLGIKLWASTLASNCDPVFRFALPSWSIFGSLREAGFCGFNPYSPIDSLSALLTTFGIAPLVFIFILFKKIKFIFREAPFWLSLAAIYGLTHYFLGVPAGTGVQRIVGYGWPVFLLATPILIKGFFNLDNKFIIKLSLFQILVAWFPFVVQQIFGYSSLAALTSIIFALPFYFWTFHLMKKQKLIDDNLSFSKN